MIALPFPPMYGILALLLVATHTLSYVSGRTHERRYQNDKALKAQAAAAIETQRLIEKNYQISVAATTVLNRERVVTQKILERVYVEVPASACPIHPSFRVLHDAAARGEDPVPGSSVDGAPVPVKDAAATVVENYGACRQDQERLRLLQDWVREIAGREVACPIQ